MGMRKENGDFMKEQLESLETMKSNNQSFTVDLGTTSKETEKYINPAQVGGLSHDAAQIYTTLLQLNPNKSYDELMNIAVSHVLTIHKSIETKLRG